jgi:uncharacterized protein (DUF362 family)/Pyruvate/2-oxoacid:ferredoxin oxidoreductase delta subunit
MRTKVAITKCLDYDQKNVDTALSQGLELIGGLGSIVKAGNKVLLKVNALMEVEPERAATTHPAIVQALIREIKKLGAFAYIGDSPGDPSADIQRTMEKTGMFSAAQKAGGEILNFQKSKIVDIDSPSQNKRIKQLKICQAVLDADVIINLPKLKTHGWTLFTGAIKNLYGVVPGFFKSRYHLIAPQPYEFSKTLVDILEIVKPQLNIMDAVIGMEGPGPSAGYPRKMGAILFSTDAVAMDAVCAEAIGYKALGIDTTKIAHQRKLGTGDLKEIKILGTPLKEIAQPDWRHSASRYNLTRFIPSWLNWLLSPIIKHLRVDPIIDDTLCQKCLICVNSCPAKTIFHKPEKVWIDLKNCFMCYCCHELCPYHAINLKRSWLAKKMGIPGPKNE